jgi:hypothetical protein
MRFVFAIAIAERDVVVGYFDHITLIHAAGDAFNIHELTFITAKQIFRVLSFHGNSAHQALGAASSPLRSLVSEFSLRPLHEKKTISIGILQRDETAAPAFIRWRLDVGTPFA